ncbi:MULTISPECIES: magnesium/cobalt transporter CorA [unclassified Shewanella]|uniref:magnesium/cobalt transporter CorA n=1 Tax=unclassified Shewanella TaxID=196818 RepID=UPI000C81648D|nr:MULTISPECIES: magnesium/cobalt transporter CorA [unclassified Shewanella]MDO6621046.1 magnesium/cobalt transporter CorA [Shewanella sp. 6_MG-2023]MDO6641746.1 magnesium/cobalt transporter CorA [Shewanella sp. 5_MG-2023]MDO6680409.1 magnesium/cobalt transporter CorA [Shewanella sp. 4_MG-2023]MDO6776913.1 magnesium/cobalt transporter CorA [Shewanella sp. 3_MG-2023]PMG29916.1 magnesium and cobalt transport protein CorA [Shewanella sp. 10N.286.52.C2]
MITAYVYENRKLTVHELNVRDSIPDRTLWLDMFKPNDDEREWLSRFSVEEVPEEEDINEIEASARFFQSKDGLHINSLFPQRVGSDVRGINVSFNLRKDFLLTIREEDIGLIRLLRNYLRLGRLDVSSPQGLMLELFTLKVDYLSDLIEDVYSVLESVGEQVFEDQELDDVFKLITLQEDSNGKIRLSLLDTQRSLRYIQRYYREHLSEENIKDLREMLSDIESLMPHSQFIFDKLNFLLDAAMGFSGIQQTKIIKIFSVAAVVFLPPTVIASSYGMNFTNMPELDWRFGYPMAIGMMLASAAGTYFFFKRKGWL